MDNSHLLNGKNGKGNASFLSDNLTNSGFTLSKLNKSLLESSSALVTTPESSSSLIITPDPIEFLTVFDNQVDGSIIHETKPDEYLAPIGQWVKIFAAAAIGVFCGTIALSSVLKYKTTVQAPAAIRPKGELRIVQSAIEGSVLSIPVRENQTVKPGDIIATVKDLRLESKLKTKRNQLIGEIQKDKQLIIKNDAQIVALQQQKLGEQTQSSSTIAGIESELSRAKRDYRDRQNISRAEVAEANSNIETAKQEKQAAEMELLVAAANLKSIQAGYQSAIAKRDRYQSVGETGAISQNLVEEARLTAEQQAQAIAAQQATIAKQNRNIARLQQLIVSAQARSIRTQVALNPSRADIEGVKHKIERERAIGATSIARSQQEQQKLLQQRVEIVNQIATNEREIAQIATDLQPTPIVAPIAGTIQDLNLRNRNQVVHPGDSIARILPTGTPMQIKANVALADIGKVDVGQVVKMRVSACPYTDHGLLSGKVTEVSADAKSSDKSSKSTPSPLAMANTYEVTVVPDALNLDRQSNKCQIRSGMEGRVDIISKEESVFQFMLSKARLLADP